jgi:peptidyl-prolyl cis-trans isomerase D
LISIRLLTYLSIFMLDYLRKHSQSVLVWILVGAIAFIFIVQFGPQSRGCGQTDLTTDFVAKVYGYTVMPNAWRWAWVMHGGDERTPKEAKAMRLRETVMDGLVERELLVHQARQLGLRVTEDDVEDSLLDNRLYLTSSVHGMGRTASSGTIPIDFTREDGSFDFETFKMFVTNRFHMTFVTFKEQQMREMLAQNMRRMVEASVHVSEAEVRAEYEKSAHRVKVGYVAFDPGFYIRRLDPTDEEVDAWIAEHADEVRARYDEQSYKYTNVERQVRTSHILLEVDPEGDPQEKEEVRERAEELAERARAGEDFAALAAKHSDDAISAKQGGDIGYKSRGQLVEEYEDVAFGMEPGEIAGPVETEFGYHVIRCEGFREGDIPYEDVEVEIGRRMMLMERARSRAEQDARALLEEVRSGTDIMTAVEELERELYPPPEDEEQAEEAAEDGRPAEEEPAAEDEKQAHDPMTPRYKESGWVQAGADSITGIGRSEEVVESVFELDEDSPLLDEVVKVGDRFHVIRLLEKKEPSEDDFAIKKAELRRALEGEKKISVFTQWIDDLREKAEAAGAIEVNEAYLRYETVQDVDGSPREEKAD